MTIIIITIIIIIIIIIITIIIIIIIIIIITLFNEGEDIDYWSPSSFHNGPPNQIKSNQIKSNVGFW